MSQVKLAGVVNRSYRYNAKGERVAATNGASGPVAVYTLYDEAGRWLGDYDANGSSKQQVVWLGESPVGVLAGAGTAQKLHYVQPDHLGTPRTVIDATRNVAIWSWNAKGEAFGNDTPNQDPDQDGTAFVFDLRFPGQRYDAATGLNYNYFRDYDAVSGRYVQSDPIGLAGGNSTYLYSGGSPIDSIDLWGLQYREANWENKYVHKVIAPPRSPDDWLGPTIGVGLGVISLPAIGYGLYELGIVALTNPATTQALAIGATEVVAGTSVTIPAAVGTGAACKVAEELVDAATLASSAARKATSTFTPGPYAGASIPARSSAQTFTTAERAAINDIGRTTGCHTCGATTAGTKSGNFVPDHQPVSSLNINNAPQRLYPHCINCSRQQGLEAARQLRKKP
ncbi:RHS repeat-associated core domain-containing protein [Lysobacter firmicutimachus]|uniref:RHS repeat-associated core domain-containing protein n=1 Tax=Lysobacter firmicutimachus TaxID=1792846 RepID=A0ABU8CWI6_9GAMM